MCLSHVLLYRHVSIDVAVIIRVNIRLQGIQEFVGLIVWTEITKIRSWPSVLWHRAISYVATDVSVEPAKFVLIFRPRISSSKFLYRISTKSPLDTSSSSTEVGRGISIAANGGRSFSKCVTKRRYVNEWAGSFDGLKVTWRKWSTRRQTCPSATSAATNPTELAGRKCIKIEVIETSSRKWVASGTCVGGDAEKNVYSWCSAGRKLAS